MKKIHLITLLVIFTVVFIDGKKISKSRSSSSSRGSSRTKYNASPTSMSYPQPSAPKPQPSLSGWQEKPAHRTQTSNSQSNPSNGHSYPSSQTGLSGNSPAKPIHNQDSIQRSNAPQQHTSHTAGQPANSQPGHSYPSSNGLSGNSGSSGAGYPQGSGLSGSGAASPQHSAGNYPSNNHGSNHQQGPPPPYSNANSYPKQQGSGVAAPPPYNAGNYPNNNYGNNYHHPQQGHPPPYSNSGGYGGYGGYHGGGSHSPQMPGYFGNYGNSGRGFGGVGRSGSVLTGVGIAGAGVGTLLTGLALWNLARSTGRSHHTVIYDNRGQPVAVAPDNSTEPAIDPILGELVNCTLTISSDNATEVLAIPCAIATSFTPEADVKDAGINTNPNDNTKCMVTVITKTGKEFMTTIPCSILLNTAAENNVTEPPLLNNGTDNVNGTMILPGDALNPNQPSALTVSGETDLNNTSLNCTPEPGVTRDPINPCFAVTQNLTVIPLQTSDNGSVTLSTPGSA